MRAQRSRHGQAKLPAVSIIVEEPMWRADLSLIRTIRRAATLAIRVAPASGKPPSRRLAACILLSDDGRLKQLNKTFRNKQSATNVLSFPAVPQLFPYLGDVALGFGVVRIEAAAQRKSLVAHAAHLAIHGILHLLGYDHDRTGSAKTMENLEILLLEKMGIGNPYAPVPVRKPTRRPKLAACPTIQAR